MDNLFSDIKQFSVVSPLNAKFCPDLNTKINNLNLQTIDSYYFFELLGDQWDSNPRPSEPQSGTLTT